VTEAKKRGRPKKESQQPQQELKGYKKWKAKFKGAGFDGTFADGSENPLAIPTDVLQNYEREGLCFKWVRESCMGQPDNKNVALHKRNGWETVEAGDFDDITTVAEAGLILMARPKAIEDKARRNQEADAAAPITTMHRRAGEGDLDGISLDARHPSARKSNFHRKTIERLPVARDD
jgi:hypothetical protein